MVNSNLNWMMFESVLNVREYVVEQRLSALRLANDFEDNRDLEAVAGKWTRRLNHLNLIIETFIRDIDKEIAGEEEGEAK